MKDWSSSFLEAMSANNLPDQFLLLATSRRALLLSMRTRSPTPLYSNLADPAGHCSESNNRHEDTGSQELSWTALASSSGGLGTQPTLGEAV